MGAKESLICALHVSQDRSSFLARTNFSLTDKTRIQSSLGHDSQRVALSSVERSLSIAYLVAIWSRNPFYTEFKEQFTVCVFI